MPQATPRPPPELVFPLTAAGNGGLDAIYLASGIAHADELEALITYDPRLADAARAAGLEVVAPA